MQLLWVSGAFLTIRKARDDTAARSLRTPEMFNG